MVTGWANGLVKRTKDSSGGRRNELLRLVRKYSNNADHSILLLFINHTLIIFVDKQIKLIDKVRVPLYLRVWEPSEAKNRKRWGFNLRYFR